MPILLARAWQGLALLLVRILNRGAVSCYGEPCRSAPWAFMARSYEGASEQSRSHVIAANLGPTAHQAHIGHWQTKHAWQASQSFHYGIFSQDCVHRSQTATAALKRLCTMP
jgi:hypothetical protein